MPVEPDPQCQRRKTAALDGEWQTATRQKARGKGLMVPDFLTHGGRLTVPDTVSDATSPVCYRALRIRQDKYLRGDDMVNLTMKVAIPIFNTALSGCQAVFAFDNASNQRPHAADALQS